VWPPPAAMAATPLVRPLTATGADLDVVELSPIWPLLLRPQHFAAPPAMAHALRASLRLIRGDEGDRRRRELVARVAELREGLAAALPQAPDGSARAAIWQLADSFTAIQPLIVGGSAEALAASAALEAQGLWVPAIRPPTVPAGSARLRITLSASHSAADVDRLIEALAVARASGVAP